MLNRYVAKQICIAQICSDAGKYIHKLKMKDDETMRKSIDSGYCGKDKAIQRAISKINSLGDKSGFHFYVTIDKEMMNDPCLIYFVFYVDGKRYQTSFHSYEPSFEKYLKKGISNRIRWDKKSSRYSCKKLIESFDF